MCADGTSQYIQGKDREVSDSEFCPSGLPCALVLIGVYMRDTGEPVMGVINQPFTRKDSTGKRQVSCITTDYVITVKGHRGVITTGAHKSIN